MPDLTKQQPTPADSKITMPVQANLPVNKTNSQVPPVTPVLATRPKRLIRPSLKVRENLGLTCDLVQVASSV